MKNKKVVLYLLIVLAIAYFATTLAINIFGGKSYKKTVFLGENAKLTLINGAFKISYDDVKINKQKVKIYFENKIIDGYISTSFEASSELDNSMHAYNNKGEYLDFESFLIAYTKDLNIDFIEIDSDYDDDINRINNYIKNSDIVVSSSKLDYLVISAFDIEKDGKEEYIYSFGLIQNDNYYSSVVMAKNNKYYLIDEVSTEYDEIYSTNLELVGIMDIDGDSEYEFVIRSSNGESGPNYYNLYNFEDTGFSKIDVD